MSKVEWDLKEPVQAHEGLIRRAVLRQPTGGDYFRLGEPVVYVRNPDGSLYPVENIEAINGYIAACLESPKPEFRSQLSLADAIRLREEVIGFFSDARMTWSSLPTSSSSNAGSTPAP